MDSTINRRQALTSIGKFMLTAATVTVAIAVATAESQAATALCCPYCNGSNVGTTSSGASMCGSCFKVW